MTWTLMVLCLAAFALVALLASAGVGLALPALDRAIDGLAPRHRPRAWLAVLAVPAILAAAVMVVSFLPSAGVGVDHCLSHDPHHPHLCLRHAPAVPDAMLLALAVFVLARVGLALGRAVLGAARTRRTLDALGLVQAPNHNMDTHNKYHVIDNINHVLDDAAPQAFVLGLVFPRVFVSRGLMAMGADIAEPVLAHERAHARTRDPLARMVASLLCSLHVPGVSRALMRRLVQAQEVAADAYAARQVGDGARVAHALVALARLRAQPAAVRLSFTDGNIAARVHALLAPRPARSAWPVVIMTSFAALLLTFIAASPGAVHHTLETLLGALS